MLIKEQLTNIKKITSGEINQLLKTQRPHFNTIYDVIKKEKEQEIFNGKCLFVTLAINEEIREGIAIVNEQNMDYLLVYENGHNGDIHLYAFEHYYDMEGFDQSLLENILKENNLSNYQSIYTIQSEEKKVTKNDEVIFHYPKLYYFSIIFESICIELNLEHDKNSRGMDWYRLEKAISEQLKALFKSRKDQLIDLYISLKESKEKNQHGVRAYIENIQVDSLEKDEEDDELDALFNKLYGAKLTEKTPEEKLAECYRDALCFDFGEEQFVLVFQTLLDDEYSLTQQMNLHYCKNQDKQYKDLAFLLKDYRDIDNRSIYEMRFYENKGSVHKSETIGSRNDLSYYPLLSKFLLAAESFLVKEENE